MLNKKDVGINGRKCYHTSRDGMLKELSVNGMRDENAENEFIFYFF